jgi:hypothetical protein
MGMRRMMRRTNGFSKKWKNLEAAYVLWADPGHANLPPDTIDLRQSQFCLVKSN